MAEIAERLDTRGAALPEDRVMATVDPLEAGNNRPCLLVVPPAVDYAGGTFDTPNLECRVIALARSSLFGTELGMTAVVTIIDLEMQSRVVAGDERRVTDRIRPTDRPGGHAAVPFQDIGIRIGDLALVEPFVAFMPRAEELDAGLAFPAGGTGAS